MDNSQQPAAQTVPPTPAQTTPAAITPTMAGPAQKQPQPVPVAPGIVTKKAAAVLPTNKNASSKKIVVGCISAFGCSIFLFIGILIAFLAFGSADNPIFKFFGVPAGEVVDALITLVNLIFLVLVFIAFIFVVVGVFKITTAKKDDKSAKNKGMMFTFGALGVMMLLIFIWVFAYFFLASNRQPSISTPIITTPLKTINLTAPISIKFDASKASINTRQFDILSYDWDFGDGTTLSGNPQTHTYTEIGNFKAKVTITVKEKLTGKDTKVEYTRDVTIQNVIANVIIKADKTKGPAPLIVNLDGSGSNSPNGELTSFAWDLDEDSAFDDGTENKATATFDKIGKYKVALRVQDSTGAFADNNIEIEATASNSPVPVITVEGADGIDLEIDKAYVFSAAASTTPEGRIEKYSWDFGDGKTATTRTATHTYKTPGDYDVFLKVIDSNKRVGETTVRFTASARQTSPLVSIKTTPVALKGVIAGQAPFDVIFDGSASQDINDNIVEYAWDFNGDGTADDTNAVTSYRFNTAGTFNVSLTVTDSTELSGKAQTVVQVEAAGLKPDLVADPIAGTVPLTVSFDASGSSYPDGRIVSYEWEFGDGGSPRIDNAKVSHQYTSIGTFTARVTAITSDNKRASTELPINVRPVPVKACYESSTSNGKAPLQVQFDPTCSTGTVINYRWNFANLGRSTERKPVYTFENAGEYDVSLEVSDNENIVDTFTSTIKVTPK